VSAAVRVAYLGPAGTFSHQAARVHFGPDARCAPGETIGDVFAAAEQGAADYGVVPVENSTEGAVTPTLDHCVETGLRIVAEIFLPIAHHLLARAEPAAVRRVYSHPQVFGQCRVWLRAHLPGVEQIPAASTARAAELAAGDPEAAALAGELAAELYGLPIRIRDTQDLSGNTTRFLALGAASPPPGGNDKTSLVFGLRHRVGALHDALGVLHRGGINLTKIESRPRRGRAWEYIFFVDVAGHAREEPLRSALAELATHCIFLTVLGSYPAAVAGGGPAGRGS